MTEADYGIVARFMLAENRPHNAGNVFIKLQKAVTKPSIERILEDLSKPPQDGSDSKICKLENGKQAVFFIRQPDGSVDPTELTALDKAIAEKEAEARDLSLSCNPLSARLRRATTEPNNDELAGQIAALEESNRAQREKLELMQQNAANMTAADKNKLQSSHDKIVKTWRKRKRLANDIVGGIMEGGYPKKKKDLVAEIGLETDEDVHIDIKEYTAD